ncbi:MAG: hypothetical protein NTX86_02430 [Candidatus Dependentiae bacterium]|nr:hypothetical protein [Candidatus Dependentiae bacterium]
MRSIMKFFSMLVVVSSTTLYSTITVTPYYRIRSQATDTARQLAGTAHQINLFNTEAFYGNVSVIGLYSKSFSANTIALSIFGEDAFLDDLYRIEDKLSFGGRTKGGSIIMSGTVSESFSRVDGQRARRPTDWLADYFYMGDNSQSYVTFTPHIQNATVDLNYYFGSNKPVCGLFARIHAPINWTQWSLRLNEIVMETSSISAFQGYFTCQDNVTLPNYLPNFTSYASGQVPLSESGIIYNPLRFAKMNALCDQAVTRLADLSWIIGYNFVNDDDYHLGAGVMIVAPTGNRPTGEFLFEPISGNGGHWEAGAHFTSHIHFWKSDDEVAHFGLYCDANITHLFKARQVRTFDLKDKPFSRYMLAAKHGPRVRDGFPGEFVPLGLTGGFAGGQYEGGPAAPSVDKIPSVQFQGEYTPVANLTTQEIKVSIPVQADFSLQLTYVNNDLNFNVGYNFWGTSCEEFHRLTTPCREQSNTTFQEHTWTLKGDAFVFGVITNPDTHLQECRALAVSQSNATIHRGTGFDVQKIGNFYEGVSIPLLESITNFGIDNPLYAFAGDRTVPIVTPNFSDPRVTIQMRTSVDPIFITEDDIDYVGVRGVSHKIYAHMGYDWSHGKHWTPYFGIGGFGEFGDNASPCDQTCQTSVKAGCAKLALTQWGAWVKVGVAFN